MIVLPTLLLFVGACGSGDLGSQEIANTSGMVKRLWIFNQSSCGGTVSNLFSSGCVLNSSWNQLVNAYAPGEPPLVLGGISNADKEPCPDDVAPGTPPSLGSAQFQCAEDLAHWPVSDNDLIVVTHRTPLQMTDASGWNNAQTIHRNLGGGVTIPVHVRTAAIGQGDCNTGFSLTITHEVFESITDQASCDCCNGQKGCTSAAEHRTINCNGYTSWVAACSPRNHEWDNTCLAPTTPICHQCTSDGHCVHGAIDSKYTALGGCASFLGTPTTDEKSTPDGVGRFNHFSNNASIYWHPQLGAWSVHGAIRGAWAQTGWERGPCGYPISDEYASGGGRRSDFQYGNITWLNGQASVGCSGSMGSDMGSSMNPCAAAGCGDGWYCSPSCGVQGQDGYRYHCFQGQTVDVDSCGGAGCHVVPGADDACDSTSMDMGCPGPVCGLNCCPTGYHCGTRGNCCPPNSCGSGCPC